MCPTVEELPAGWQVKRLGSFCTKIGTGATPRGGSEVYLNSRVSHALVRSQHVFDRRFDVSGLAFISDLHARELRNAEVQSGDILLNITGDGVTFGRSCIVPDRILPACVNQHVSIIRPDHRACDPGYLLSVLTHPATKGYIESFNSGGSRRAITKGHIESFEIPLPSLPEQKAIAQILGSLDDKIELNRRMNVTLEAMARALFQNWFVDFDPVRAKLDGRKPAGLDAATADLFPVHFQDSPLGPIPQGWEVKTADEVSTVGIGKTPPRKEHQWFSDNPSDMPWMSIRDLGDAGVFISHTSEFLTAEAVEKFRVRRIPNDTVVLSFKLTMGRVAITDGEMLSNEAIAHFRLNPKTPFGTSYLYCYLKGFSYDQLGSTSSIATAINSDMVRGIRVLIPHKSIAEAFERTVKPLFTQMKNSQKQAHTLATLRDTLLPKLLSGELSVAETKKRALIGA
ncbi:MAG: restriction endonuclease subunit S [Planctomycetes bacterium]|nr:restriction endonuclease subunit S [Planctomycetota bacterium]